MGIDAIVTLGGLIVPPVFDFAKKLFIKPSRDTPEATMSTLATTKPEVLPEYLRATVDHLRAQVDFFNRDVIGTPSTWVVDLRAAIRPIVVILALFALVTGGLEIAGVIIPKLDAGTRLFAEGVIASWFGSRLTKE